MDSANLNLKVGIVRKETHSGLTEKSTFMSTEILPNSVYKGLY